MPLPGAHYGAFLGGAVVVFSDGYRHDDANYRKQPHHGRCQRRECEQDEDIRYCAGQWLCRDLRRPCCTVSGFRGYRHGDRHRRHRPRIGHHRRSNPEKAFHRHQNSERFYRVGHLQADDRLCVVCRDESFGSETPYRIICPFDADCLKVDCREKGLQGRGDPAEWAIHGTEKAHCRLWNGGHRHPSGFYRDQAYGASPGRVFKDA